MTKKPDLVVFNEEKESYDASLRPYGTNASSPAIKLPNTATWKNDGVEKVNKLLKSRFKEIKQAYQDLMSQFEYNDLVYSAKFNFEPIVGETYFLYNSKNKEPFLSIIPPNQCTFEHLGSFRLNSQKMWEKLV